MANKNRRGPEEKPGPDVLGPLQDIIRQLREGKLAREHLQAFAEHRNPFEEKKLDGAVCLFADYARPLAEMLKDGRFDYVNPDITENNFPSKESGSREVEFVLCHPNRVISSGEVLKEMEGQNLRPATLKELIAFGTKYPNLQREFPIVALGSVWQGWYGDRGVPYLWGDGSVRGLSLRWFGGGWVSSCRFLGVRK